MKPKKGKPLGGAPPRAGRWSKQQTEQTRRTGERTGWVVLAALAVLLAAGVGGAAYGMGRELDAGLLAQRREASRRPDWVPIASLPRWVPEAFLAVVDTGSFHSGPELGPGDRPRLAGDLVRQVHRIDGSVRGEARELALTPLLERRLTTRALLELYLNRIDLGRSGTWPVYGIHHASLEYFGKPPQEMTPGEAATLAAVLLPPRLRRPDATPGAVGPRRNEVLRHMLARGVIDREAYEGARREPLSFQPGEEHAPMTRPANWRDAPVLIRLPASLNPQPDSSRQGEPAGE